MMVDLDDLVERTFKEKFPLYYKLVIYKIDGKQNAEIQDLLYLLSKHIEKFYKRFCIFFTIEQYIRKFC